MHQTKVKTIWKGTTVAVNEFEIQKGIFAGGLRIIHDDEFMDVSTEELLSIDMDIRGRIFKDKWKPNKTYRLIDFNWHPDKQHKLL